MYLKFNIYNLFTVKPLLSGTLLSGHPLLKHADFKVHVRVHYMEHVPWQIDWM